MYHSDLVIFENLCFT